MWSFTLNWNLRNRLSAGEAVYTPTQHVFYPIVSNNLNEVSSG